MGKQITSQLVQHLATLAQLSISEEQTRDLTSDLQSIMEHIERIQELDLEGVDDTPAAQAVNIWRPDENSPGLSQTEALQNAPYTHKGYFVVPGIFDEEV